MDFIGIDWGSSTVRAWRMHGSVVTAQRREKLILSASTRADRIKLLTELRDAMGPTLPVVACGMVGSRSGLVQAGYVPCPATPSAVLDRTIESHGIRIVPGLTCRSPAGEPDVMRGEETQLLGLGMRNDGLVCLPGTHSKWVEMEGGVVRRFATAFTGELRALLLTHGLLAAALRDGPIDEVAFDEGAACAARKGGLLHHLFLARSRVIRGRATAEATSSWLSGLLLAHEVDAMTAALGDRRVTVVGTPSLAARYARIIGANAVIVDGDEAVRDGLSIVARHHAS